MASSEETPPRGAGILRHEPRRQQWEPAADRDLVAAEAIDQHITDHFGTIAYVWHEIASDMIHLDVQVVEPAAERPFFTLVTSGMSDRPMTIPAGVDVTPYAELMLCLPSDWPLTEEAFRDESAYWPIRLLKTVARLPHEYDTWIGVWHSVPNGDPPEPYADDTPFAGVLVAPMVRCRPQAHTIRTGTGKEIALLALVPLHPAEIDLKVSQGTAALLDAFNRREVSEVFDPARPSSV